jgi:pimeloyl-ACP methyl ester carboxylesterase
MTVVFVHGVPETHHVWDDLRSQLGRVHSIAVALPGFGNSLPDGFGATMDEYAAWLISELEAVGEPVDLVGHDWGGILTLRVASLRPELITRWVSDAPGAFDASFAWHELAKLWQTPDAGEEFMAAYEGMAVNDRAATFTGFGVPQAKAEEMASWWDSTMSRCILSLYRSATAVHTDWGPALDGMRVPGLVIRPTEDAFSDGEALQRVVRRTGASVVPLEGLGHWWPLQDPARGAAALEAFWSSQ